MEGQVGAILQQAGNLGGLALASVGLFFLHRESLKTHREELEKQRKLELRRVKVIMRRFKKQDHSLAELFRLVEILVRPPGEHHE